MGDPVHRGQAEAGTRLIEPARKQEFRPGSRSDGLAPISVAARYLSARPRHWLALAAIAVAAIVADQLTKHIVASQLWLDENMHYTSASFHSGAEPLEEAQLAKCKILYEYAEMTPDKRVLDIGCGWGSNLLYQKTRGTKVAHGITLSTAQCEWAQTKMGLPAS